MPAQLTTCHSSAVLGLIRYAMYLDTRNRQCFEEACRSKRTEWRLAATCLGRKHPQAMEAYKECVRMLGDDEENVGELVDLAEEMDNLASFDVVGRENVGSDLEGGTEV